MSSKAVSGCSTGTARDWLGSRMISGRTKVVVMERSSREKKVVDAGFEPSLSTRADLGRLDAVQFGLDLPGMGREQENPVADPDGLLDRVRDEDHREPRILPELQKLVLHLAPGERV